MVKFQFLIMLSIQLVNYLYSHNIVNMSSPNILKNKIIRTFTFRAKQNKGVIFNFAIIHVFE